MSKKVDDEVDRADNDIMQRCTPDLMTVPEALDYLHQVEERCRTAREALRQENGLDDDG